LIVLEFFTLLLFGWNKHMRGLFANDYRCGFCFSNIAKHLITN